MSLEPSCKDCGHDENYHKRRIQPPDPVCYHRDCECMEYTPEERED